MLWAGVGVGAIGDAGFVDVAASCGGASGRAGAGPGQSFLCRAGGSRRGLCPGPRDIWTKMMGAPCTSCQRSNCICIWRGRRRRPSFGAGAREAYGYRGHISPNGVIPLAALGPVRAGLRGATCSALQGPEDYARLCRAVLEERRAKGVVYTEVFLCPDFCGGRDQGRLAPNMWRRWPRRPRAGGRVHHDARDCPDGDPPAWTRRRRASGGAVCGGYVRRAGGFVVGHGTRRRRDVGKPKDFAWGPSTVRARRVLGLTVHAGEWGGPRRCARRCAIWARAASATACGPSRIWRWWIELAEKGWFWNVARGRTLRLGLYPDWKSHPIGALLHREVKVTGQHR